MVKGMLLSLDLDGTLLDIHGQCLELYGSKRGVSETNFDAIQKAISNGITVIFNTARDFARAQEATPKFKLDTQPGVYCNGSLVLGKNGERLFESCVEADMLKILVKLAKKHKGICGIFAYSADGHEICCGNEAIIKKFIKNWGVLNAKIISMDEFLNSTNVFTGVRFVGTRLDEAFANVLEEEKLPDDVYMDVYSDGKCVMFGKKGIDKRSGLEMLAKHLEVPCDADHVIHMGDQEADISPFPVVRGIAPGNAADICIKAAHHVTTDHNDKDRPAVAYVIERLLEVDSNVEPSRRFVGWPRDLV